MNFPNYLLYQQVSYDQQADAMYLKITINPVVETDMKQQDIIVDYDQDGDIVGVEILNASKHQDHIKTILFSGISTQLWASSSLSTSSKDMKKDLTLSTFS